MSIGVDLFTNESNFAQNNQSLQADVSNSGFKNNRFARSIRGESSIFSNLNSMPQEMSPNNYGKTTYVNKSMKKSIKLSKVKGAT